MARTAQRIQLMDADLRSIHTCLRRGTIGARTQNVLPLASEIFMGASSDVVGVSWNTPTMRCTMPTWPLNVFAHTWPVAVPPRVRRDVVRSPTI